MKLKWMSGEIQVESPHPFAIRGFFFRGKQDPFANLKQRARRDVPRARNYKFEHRSAGVILFCHDLGL